MTTGRTTEAERAARAHLLAVAEPGDPATAAAVREHGAEEVVRQLAAGTSPPVRRADGKQVELDHTGALRRRLALDPDSQVVLERGRAAGARLVCPGDDEWPPGLEGLWSVEREGAGGPPLGLWVRGPLDLRATSNRAVGVVGARAATAYGVDVAGELAADLAERGWTVVSGAAYGIDVAAHRGALAVRGQTAAVLACGVDVYYPRGHASVLARIVEEGLLVSECGIGAHPQRRWFLARNRLIAALTAGVVVVEAAARSGSLNTYRWARDLDRRALGVPGPVTSALSAGVHQALRAQEMILVTCANDIEADLARVGDVDEPRLQGERQAVDGLDHAAAVVLDAVPSRGVILPEELLRRTGLALPVCLDAVGRLLDRGLLAGDGMGWRLGPALRRGSA